MCEVTSYLLCNTEWIVWLNDVEWRQTRQVLSLPSGAYSSHIHRELSFITYICELFNLNIYQLIFQMAWRLIKTAYTITLGYSLHSNVKTDTYQSEGNTHFPNVYYIELDCEFTLYQNTTGLPLWVHNLVKVWHHNLKILVNAQHICTYHVKRSITCCLAGVTEQENSALTWFTQRAAAWVWHSMSPGLNVTRHCQGSCLRLPAYVRKHALGPSYIRPWVSTFSASPVSPCKESIFSSKFICSIV